MKKFFSLAFPCFLSISSKAKEVYLIQNEKLLILLLMIA